MRDQISKMNREGRGGTVGSLYEFLSSKEGSKAIESLFFVRKSDDEILAWYARVPQFHVFQVALLELTDSQLRQMEKNNVQLYKSGRNVGALGFVRRLLKGRSKKPHRETNGVRKVPLVRGENPHQAYHDRMKEILQTEGKGQS